MNNWIALNTPTKKEWITKAIEIITLEIVAFRLQNNEAEYPETWALVENNLIYPLKKKTKYKTIIFILFFISVYLPFLSVLLYSIHIACCMCCKMKVQEKLKDSYVCDIV